MRITRQISGPGRSATAPTVPKRDTAQAAASGRPAASSANSGTERVASVPPVEGAARRRRRTDFLNATAIRRHSAAFVAQLVSQIFGRPQQVARAAPRRPCGNAYDATNELLERNLTPQRNRVNWRG